MLSLGLSLCKRTVEYLVSAKVVLFVCCLCDPEETEKIHKFLCGKNFTSNELFINWASPVPGIK